MSEPPHSNPLPSPADIIVTDFVKHVTAIQSGFVKGIYLTGSLPLGDFIASKSDIDFIVLCAELPNKVITTQLKRIHHALSRKFRKPDLSGHYMAMDSLHTEKPQLVDTLTFHEGSLKYSKFDMAIISLYELKSHAWTVYGLPADQIVVDIPPIMLHRFLFENMNTYWKKWVAARASYHNRKLLLLTFPRFTEWAVLGIARQLYTLQTDKIVSKTEAGYYCLKHLPEQFHPIVQQALVIRQDNRSYPLVKSYAIRPSFERMSQTLACAEYLPKKKLARVWSLVI